MEPPESKGIFETVTISKDQRTVFCPGCGAEARCALGLNTVEQALLPAQCPKCGADFFLQLVTKDDTPLRMIADGLSELSSHWDPIELGLIERASREVQALIRGTPGLVEDVRFEIVRTEAGCDIIPKSNAAIRVLEMLEESGRDRLRGI